jgi:hypothetical protein
MALIELAIRSAKVEGKITKLSDGGGGLQLWVTGDGAKRWRLAYRYAGGQKVLAVGVYPDVGLKEARTARQDAERLLSEGGDPSSAKKRAKAAQGRSAANTFEAISAELVDKKRREGKAANTVGKSEWLLSLALPAIGTRPIKEIAAPDILAVLRKVESRGKLETAKRLRATIGQVFRYAVATGRADADPTGALAGAIASPADPLYFEYEGSVTTPPCPETVNWVVFRTPIEASPGQIERGAVFPMDARPIQPLDRRFVLEGGG